jgi:hypothetical protein
VDIEKTVEFILEQQAQAEVHRTRTEANLSRLSDGLAQRDRLGARTDARLDRAIRLGVQEARNERRKRRELDEKLTQLAAAQLVTEEKVQRLSDKIDAIVDLRRNGGNGHPPA